MKKILLFVLIASSVQFYCYSQNDSIIYNIVNLKVNDENDLFGVSYFEENKIVFTSNLLNKRGKAEFTDAVPKVTLYQGEIDEYRNIVNVSILPKK